MLLMLPPSTKGNYQFGATMANAWYPWQDKGQARKELVSLGQDLLLLPSHPPFEKPDSICLALISSYAGFSPSYKLQLV